jgi:hypothetical protein
VQTWVCLGWFRLFLVIFLDRCSLGDIQAKLYLTLLGLVVNFGILISRNLDISIIGFY